MCIKSNFINYIIIAISMLALIGLILHGEDLVIYIMKTFQL